MERRLGGRLVIFFLLSFFLFLFSIFGRGEPILARLSLYYDFFFLFFLFVLEVFFFSVPIFFFLLRENLLYCCFFPSYFSAPPDLGGRLWVWERAVGMDLDLDLDCIGFGFGFGLCI